MQQTLDELQTVSGVVGASVFHIEKGLLANSLPRIFKPDRLVGVGEQLSKLYSVGELNFADLTDLTLNYDESVVVVRSLNEDMLVFVFCDAEYNRNLLSTSLNLFKEDFIAGKFDGHVAPVQKAAPSAPKAPRPAAGDRALDELFEVLSERLRKVAGPMADLIFDDHLELWQQKGGNAANLDDLIDAICAEIDDQEKIDRYRQLVEADLQAFEKG